MPRIKKSCIEEIKARVSVYDVVSAYVNLKKSGSAYKGLSPFANEKTPSFFVYPDKGFYYCFSTSQGGDIFEFIKIKENLSFYEAVEFIANRFSIKLEYEDGGGIASPSRRKQLFDIHEDAANWYSEQFFADTPEAAEIREYWVKERGFTLEDAKELRIGYAPINSDGLKRILHQKKYSSDAIIGSGIFSARDGESNIRNFYPRFRGRMMIPISDIQGRVIAFTARKTRFTPQIASEEGKYVNSRDTDIFKKNLVVFNMDKAKNSARDKNYCIVVEGQLDAIRMYCSGFKNTVATQGTAAGAEHFALIKRFANKVVLLFDGDNAGRHAALRVIPICFKAELEPFVAVIPNGDDPDSMIKNCGVEAMKELVENKKCTALSFAAREILADNPNPTPQDRLSAMQALFEIVDNCQSKVLRDDYLREISNSLMCDLKSVIQDYRKWKDSSHQPLKTPVQPAQKTENLSQGMLTNAISDALMVSLHYENVAEGLAQIIRDAWIADGSLEGKVLARLLALYREGIEFNLSDIDTFFDDADEKNLIYKINTEQYSKIDNPIKYANDAVKKIYRNFLSKEIDSLNKELSETDISNEKQKLEILKKISKLRKESKIPPAQIETL